MLLALFRARFRALLLTVALSLAAPRIASGLRRFGERRRRRGGNSLTWRVPLGAAEALEYASGRHRTGRRGARRLGTGRLGTGRLGTGRLGTGRLGLGRLGTGGRRR